MKRFLVLTFGIVAYTAFLSAVLYGIGFIGNIYVWKAIDNGSNPNPGSGFAIDLALIALFGLQHSLMARQGFKRRAAVLIPQPAERSLFVLCGSLCLLLLFWQWRPFGTYLWSFPSGPIHILFMILYGVGWLIVILSTFLIDHFDFTGLRQVYLYLIGREYMPVQFKQRLLYRIVRHPMMLGLLIVFWVTPKMSLGHFIFSAGMTIYILVGLIFEERDLLRNFGEKYSHYRQHVPSLIPALKKKRSLSA